jgi:HSP20 family protein
MVPVKKTVPATAPVADPWHAFRGEMDRLFDRFSSGFGFPSLRRSFWREPTWDYETTFDIASPKVDVTEDPTAYKVTAELPGLVEKDVEISVTGGMLTLKGEKQQEKEEKGKEYWVSERSYGSFQRSFSLPEGVDADKISAVFAKGVLTVTLPKLPEVQKATKKIEVKAA